jgi:murein DD-endopeptidase MepM/ murein hydrolase activator NlpD
MNHTPARRLILLPALFIVMGSPGCVPEDETASPEESVATAAEVAPSAAARAEPDAFTPLVAVALASPHPVVATDGQRHLLYELQVTNVTGSAATITAVETLDSGSGAVLATLEGSALATQLNIPAGEALNAGATTFLFLDLVQPPRARLPRGLLHLFDVTLQPDAATVAHRFRSGATRVSADAPVVLAAPLRGPRWIAVNGCCDSTHRRAVLPINGAFHLAQRFAIDFLQLGPDGRLLTGPPAALASYPAYGNPVLSAAPGVVVRIRDGLPDNVPGALPPDPTPETAAGNHVLVDIGGRFALYAHLEPGSLRVRVGQRVAAGQLLGLVGNSGNSDSPHLHFHVDDAASPLAADGLPLLLAAFRSDGVVANPEEVLGGDVARFDPALSGSFTERLPLDLQELSF